VDDNAYKIINDAFAVSRSVSVTFDRSVSALLAFAERLDRRFEPCAIGRTTVALAPQSAGKLSAAAAHLVFACLPRHARHQEKIRKRSQWNWQKGANGPPDSCLLENGIQAGDDAALTVKIIAPASVDAIAC
jgi:hypothetical protein